MNFEEIQQHTIRIEQVSLEQMELMTDILGKQERICKLFWAEDGKDILLAFCSNDKYIRALEFMDYLVEDCAIVRKNETVAKALVSSVFFQLMMLELEADSMEELLQKMVDAYYTNCDWINARRYAQEQHTSILELPKYAKKRVAWAYVRTTDIIEEGSKFYLKSLENESAMVLEASNDLYIMIGCRGETYYIAREKFEQTYEDTQEKLDIYEQMLDYLPEITLYEDGRYITLDEKAYLCYPKSSNGIYARPLERRTKVFNPYNQEEYFLGRVGDYLAIRQDDLSDMYIIQQDIFHETYEKVE